MEYGRSAAGFHDVMGGLESMALVAASSGVSILGDVVSRGGRRCKRLIGPA